MKPKYYITTAITYTSRKPHVGNTYEIVMTDAVARYKKQMGYDVFFLTGTDEHGQKIEEYAKAANISCKEYVDKVAGQIREINDKLNCKYDHFIRTTDPEHEACVQKIFKKFYDQGDIYKSEYEGWYCVPCETFYTDSQLKDGCCPDCGRPVRKEKEEAYFLKMSKYQDRLVEHIKNNPDFIYPESRKNEMLNNFILPGVQDLCVSRTTFKWGVPVDFDPGHVIYVWVDALSNYITALGYDPDGSSEQFEKFWPCDCHVIGKDILRFHTIYWPIFLMALGLPLPEKVFGHPWLLTGNDKMSKSKNNVIYADDLCDLFGVDAVRYFLLSEMPFAQDGNISYEGMIASYNADLANNLGNLVNRTIAMNQKYFDRVIQAPTKPEALDEELKNAFAEAKSAMCEHFDQFRIAAGIEDIFNFARRCNKYIDETTPWSLAKDEAQKDRLGTVLYNLLESIRLLAVMVAPIMPDTANEIFRQLNVQPETNLDAAVFGILEAGKETNAPAPLFQRLDEKAKTKEIEELQERYAKMNAAAAKEVDLTGDSNKEIKPEITFDDFMKNDLIVAQVLTCEPVKKSEKLLCLTLDDGSGQPRQVVSGIAKYYRPEDLIGKKVTVIANLKPAKLCGLLSQGMILAADGADGDVKVLFVDDSLPCGSKIH